MESVHAGGGKRNLRQAVHISAVGSIRPTCVLGGMPCSGRRRRNSCARLPGAGGLTLAPMKPRPHGKTAQAQGTEENCDFLASIPMAGKVECLFEAVRQRRVLP